MNVSCAAALKSAIRVDDASGDGAAFASGQVMDSAGCFVEVSEAVARKEYEDMVARRDEK